MKIYIQTDIEGVAGNVFFESRKEKSYENYEHRRRMYKLLTGEVNAAAKAAFDAGASEVVINDNHGSGYNIIFEELDPRCEIIHGRNCSGPHWLPELDKSFDAMVLIGMHPMAGTPKGLLQHSKWDINDGKIFLSEASMAAAIAGDHGVPTVFISGDDMVTDEVKAKIPSIKTAAVKKSLSPYMGRCVMPERAREMIYEGVKKALKAKASIKPYKIKGPVKLQLIESNKGNHDQSRGYYSVIPEGITRKTINDAFCDFLRQVPWCTFDMLHPDGFEYP